MENGPKQNHKPNEEPNSLNVGDLIRVLERSVHRNKFKNVLFKMHWQMIALSVIEFLKVIL